jgi:hypothetical protein
MALDDFFEGEVLVAVAVTAAVASPTVRRAIRKGIVYGLAGLLKLGDTVTATARGVRQEAEQTRAEAAASAPSRQTTIEPATS